jgi:hypothetical protein
VQRAENRRERVSQLGRGGSLWSCDKVRRDPSWKRRFLKEKGGARRGAGRGHRGPSYRAVDPPRPPGSGYRLRCPAMSTASPVWPTARVLRAPWVLLLVVLAPQRLVGDGDFYHCTWKVVLNSFHSVGLTNSTRVYLLRLTPRPATGEGS